MQYCNRRTFLVLFLLFAAFLPSRPLFAAEHLSTAQAPKHLDAGKASASEAGIEIIRGLHALFAHNGLFSTGWHRVNECGIRFSGRRLNAKIPLKGLASEPRNSPLDFRAVTIYLRQQEGFYLNKLPQGPRSPPLITPFVKA